MSFLNNNTKKSLFCQKIGKKNASSPIKWQIVALLESLLGVSPKCVSSTKKRYSETCTVSGRSPPGRPRKEIRKNPTSIKNTPLILILRLKGDLNRDLIGQLMIGPELKNEKFPKFCISRLQNGGGLAGI
ncbi:hypothetical protein BpHYR1_020276 [Brachionus plicatilis]|uniref:Uncharacterized protein n=1 Tax=Brachionus plicatilis TaxID=10195 RepID=A0A3M7RYB0_BRAPC|nr:hypothetical protein BpHYR1_020276 [Brachionus plicatilis]